MKKIFKQYYYKLLDDYLFLSPNIDKDIELFQSIIVDKEHVEYLNENLKFIYKENIYPSFIENNIDKLLDFLMKNGDKNDRFLLGLNKNLKTSDSYKIYYLELITKFDELELYLHPYQAIKEEDLINSIRYDFLVFQSYFFSSVDYDKYLPNLLNNPYYLLSTKKFLIEIPKLFNNKKIKRRTYDVLEVLLKNTNDKKQQKDIENVLKKLNVNSVNYCSIFELENIYLSLLTKKLMASDEDVKCDLINSDYYLNYLKEVIDDFQNNLDEDGKKRILKFLNSLLDINNSNEKKVFLNELIYNYSKLKCVEKEDIYEMEYAQKVPLLEKIIDKIYRVDLDDIIFTMKYSMKSDFNYIEALLKTEEEFTQLLKDNYFKFPYFIYTIQYLLNCEVNLDNEILYNRIKRVLEHQKNEYITFFEKMDIKIMQKKIEKKRG